MKKLLFIFLFLSFLIVLFFSFFSFSKITGTAMEPSLKNGASVLFWKRGTPQRGDIVIYATKNQMDYIGRVVGLPTESVRVENGNLYIDNNVGKYRVEEEYLNPDTRTFAYKEEKWFKMGKFDYLILTDKRADRISIPAGIINKNNIKGTLFYKF